MATTLFSAALSASLTDAVSAKAAGYTAAASRTYVDASGLLQTTTGPRFVSFGGQHYLLLEPAGTNTCSNSHNLAPSGTWSSNTGIVSSDGTTVAGVPVYKLTAISTDPDDRANLDQGALIMPGSTWTYSAFIKQGTAPVFYFRFRLNDVDPYNLAAGFSFATQTWTAINTGSSAVFKGGGYDVVANGYRVWCTWYFPTAAETAWPVAAGGQGAYMGVGFSTTDGNVCTVGQYGYCGGVQFEPSACVTSLIPTSGAAATRPTEAGAVAWAFSTLVSGAAPGLTGASGAVALDVVPRFPAPAGSFSLLSAGAATPLLAVSAANLVASDGTSSVAAAWTRDALAACVVSWSAGTFFLSVNGAQTGTVAYDGSFDPGASLTLGPALPGPTLFGNLSLVATVGVYVCTPSGQVHAGGGATVTAVATGRRSYTCTPSGQVLAGGSAQAACVKAISSRTLNGCALFPANTVFYQRADQLPVHPHNADYLSWYVTMVAGAGFEQEFGAVSENKWMGIPYNVVPGTQALVPVGFNPGAYSDESDAGPDPAHPRNFPIPTTPVIESWYVDTSASIDGSNGVLYNPGDDLHLLVLDPANKRLFEFYGFCPDGSGGWTCTDDAWWDLTSPATRTLGWTSTDAAGLPILPFLFTYDELAAAVAASDFSSEAGIKDLGHVLRFTFSVGVMKRRAFVWPATHQTDTSGVDDAYAFPLGLWFRLRAGYPVFNADGSSKYPAMIMVVIQTLKRYGVILADTGSTMGVQGVPDSRYINDDMHRLREVMLQEADGTFNLELVDPSSLKVSDTSYATTAMVDTVQAYACVPSGSAGTGGQGTVVTRRAVRPQGGARCLGGAGGNWVRGAASVATLFSADLASSLADAVSGFAPGYAAPGAKTYVDPATGKLALTTGPRFEKSVDGGVRLLLEPAATNLLSYWHPDTTSDWYTSDQSGATCALTEYAAGFLGACSYMFRCTDTSVCKRYMFMSPVPAASVADNVWLTVTFAIKRHDYDYVKLILQTKDNWPEYIYQFSTHTPTSVGYENCTAQYWGQVDGFDIVSMTVLSGAGTMNDTIIPQLWLYDGANTSFAGTVDSGVEIAAGQLEASRFRTSFIPTAGAPATRASEAGAVSWPFASVAGGAKSVFAAVKGSAALTLEPLVDQALQGSDMLLSADGGATGLLAMTGTGLASTDDGGTLVLTKTWTADEVFAIEVDWDGATRTLIGGAHQATGSHTTFSAGSALALCPTLSAPVRVSGVQLQSTLNGVSGVLAAGLAGVACRAPAVLASAGAVAGHLAAVRTAAPGLAGASGQVLVPLAGARTAATLSSYLSASVAVSLDGVIMQGGESAVGDAALGCGPLAAAVAVSSGEGGRVAATLGPARLSVLSGAVAKGKAALALGGARLASAGTVRDLDLHEGELLVVVDTGGTGDYLSLVECLSAEAIDLVAANYRLRILCKATTGLADYGPVSLQGFGTDATHYVRIVIDPAYRYHDDFDPTKYRLVCDTPYAFDLVCNNLQVEGMQIYLRGANKPFGLVAKGPVNEGGNFLRLYGCFVHADSTDVVPGNTRPLAFRAGDPDFRHG